MKKANQILFEATNQNHEANVDHVLREIENVVTLTNKKSKASLAAKTVLGNDKNILKINALLSRASIIMEDVLSMISYELAK